MFASIVHQFSSLFRRQFSHRFVHRFLLENGSQMAIPRNTCAASFSILLRIWLTFGSLWLPFASLWLTFDSLWFPFGSLLAPFSSLLVPLGSLLLTLGFDFLRIRRIPCLQCSKCFLANSYLPHPLRTLKPSLYNPPSM